MIKIHLFAHGVSQDLGFIKNRDTGEIERPILRTVKLHAVQSGSPVNDQVFAAVPNAHLDIGAMRADVPEFEIGAEYEVTIKKVEKS